MKDLENIFVNREFLDIWYDNYRKLEHYCKEGKEATVRIDAELERWAETQKRIRHLLPAGLNKKLSLLAFDFEDKDKSWEESFGQLLEFVNQHGHAYLPDEKEYEALKDWLNRQTINKSLLSANQLQKLESLGVNWEIPVTRDHRWELMYRKLQDFYAAFGHSRVPQKWKKDKKLAHWVQVQRRMYTQGKLRKDREEKLLRVDFVWTIKTVFDSQWKKYYDELEAFYRRHGHTKVPSRFTKMVRWIERQRAAKANNIMPADREELLNGLNFIWSYDGIKKKEWEEKYRQLKAYRKKHGHSFVPVNCKENKVLGTWVATQRWLESKGKLAPEKKQKLDDLGFVWSKDTLKKLNSRYSSKWEESFLKLKNYKKIHGTCQVSLKIDPVLQRWTCAQRNAFYAGKLSQDRLDRLNGIRFPWSIKEGYWMKMYDALLEFKARYGHTKVPFQWSKNHKLADWVYRTKVNKDNLEVQKIELLDEIGFDWTLARRNVVPWKTMYKRLVDFKHEHGHTQVPVKWKKDPKLGKWVSRMRYEKDNLDPERVLLLDAIDFNWAYRSKKGRQVQPEYQQEEEGIQ